MNSGDAAGDVYFGLYEFALPVICDPKYNDSRVLNCKNTPILSIPEFNVYTASTVEIDTRMGQYAGCNPNANNGTFQCGAFGDSCWYETPMFRDFRDVCDPKECHCEAVDSKSVGVDVCNMCEVCE